MSKDPTNFREAENVLLIGVIEGEGIEGDPKEMVQYIVTKDGSILGKLDRDWMYRD